MFFRAWEHAALTALGDVEILVLDPVQAVALVVVAGNAQTFVWRPALEHVLLLAGMVFLNKPAMSSRI